MSTERPPLPERVSTPVPQIKDPGASWRKGTSFVNAVRALARKMSDETPDETL